MGGPVKAGEREAIVTGFGVWGRRQAARAATLAIVAAGLIGLGGGTARAELQDLPEAELSLSRALSIALQNNLDLVSARINPQISETQVENNRSNFDPNLAATFNFSESVAAAQANQFTAPNIERESSQVSIDQLLGWGGDYRAAFSLTRSDAAFNAVNPQFSSSLSVDYGQELLQGFGREVNQEQLLLARRNLEISYDQLDQTTQQTINTVESAYWDLVAARRALVVEETALIRANRFLELNRRQVEVGTLAPIEITQAEADVAAQVERVIVAEVTLENREDDLRNLLGVEFGDSMWVSRLIPTDAPMEQSAPINLQSAIDMAKDKRPELREARKNIANNELTERATLNRVAPSLRASAGFTSTGDNIIAQPILGPDGMQIIDPIFGPLQENVGVDLVDSIEEIGDVVNYDWRVGLEFRLPLFNRAARANHAGAKLRTEQSRINVDRLERQVEVEVRQAVRGVTSGEQRLAAARASVRLERKQLEAEQKKFENGMSTSFEVLTFQNQLATAELSEINALVDLAKARTTLELTKGTLLSARGLKLQTENN